MIASKNLLATMAFLCGTLAFAGEPVDINTASAEVLAETISGVGIKRAQAIVTHRQENGPFLTVDDLVDVSGVGQTTVDRSRDLLTIGGSGQ